MRTALNVVATVDNVTVSRAVADADAVACLDHLHQAVKGMSIQLFRQLNDMLVQN